MSVENENAVRNLYHLAEIRDIDGFVGAFTEDGTFTDKSINVTYRGRGIGETVVNFAKAFPDMVGGHALADDVGVVGGNVEEAAGAEAFIVDQGYVADGGADAGAEDAELGVALLLEPVEASAGVLDGLAVGLEGEANIRAANLVGALVAVSHAAVMVGHAHFEDRNAHALNPVAKAVLAVPFGVPVGEEEDGGAGAVAFPTRAS